MHPFSLSALNNSLSLVKSCIKNVEVPGVDFSNKMLIYTIFFIDSPNVHNEDSSVHPHLVSTKGLTY